MSSFSAPQRNSIISRIGSVALALLLIVVVAEQTRSLYVFPQPDAMRWDGDETWLMREFQTQWQHGILQNPDAPLSSMEHGNGLLLNSVWINAALYGAPAVLFFPEWSLVEIGRTITFLLALSLILYVYFFQRRYGVPSWLAICTCLLLVGNRAFFYASHSARYDLLTALGVIILLDLLTRTLETLRAKQMLQRSQRLLLLLLPALCLAWSIHLPRIAAVPYLLILAIIARANWKMATIVIAANVAALALLIIPEYFLMGNWSFFPPYPKSSEFVLAFSNVPMFHVFSIAIAKATVVERFGSIFHEAPVALTLSIVILASSTIVLLLRRARVPGGVWNLLILSTLVVFSWAISSRFVSFYGIYILPVLVLISAVVLNWIYRESAHALQRWLGSAYVAVAVAAGILAFRDAAIARERGNIITSSIQSATTQALAAIDSTHPSSQPIVLTTLQLQDFLQRKSQVRCINSLYREYPADTTPSLAEFLRLEHVNYILMETKELNPGEVKCDGRRVDTMSSFYGTYDDWGYDYFDRSQPPNDTLLLLRVRGN